MSETYREPVSALPSAWVQRIFHELSLTFGTRFTDMWAGIEAEELHRKWARALVGFDGSAIRGALTACEQPGMVAPTLPVFRGLCADFARRNVPKLPLLDSPEISQERLKEVSEKIAEVVKPKQEGYDYRRWAKDLMDRHRAGEKLLMVQIDMASSVVKMQ